MNGRAAGLDRAFALTLAKGLSVLESFVSGRPAMSNAEIASITGMPRPTVARLTQTLSELGYLRVGPDRGKFQLWTRVLTLAHPILANMRLRQIARPLMQELAASVRGTVSIGILDDASAVYVETARAAELAANTREIGFTAPILVTAMGRALYAMLDQPRRMTLERDFETNIADLWHRNQTEFRHAVQDVAERGFCVTRGSFSQELNAVGVPLFQDVTAGGVCYAINCAIPAFRLKSSELETEIGPRLVDLAHTIQATAGMPAPIILQSGHSWKPAKFNGASRSPA